MDIVLLVEDETNVRENIIDLLDSSNYEVTAVSNGNEALNFVNRKIPDIIISDIMMPGMNGYELFNNVRNIPGADTVPFLFLSAKVESADIRKGMNMGADDYITKPFKAADLLHSIELRLNKQKAAMKRIEGITSNISMYVPHELRTPLVSILGFSDLLVNQYSQMTRDEIIDMALKINIAGKRLSKTIDKFISFVESDLMLNKKEGYKTDANLFTASAEKVIYSAINSAGAERLRDFTIDVTDAPLMMAEEHFEYIAAELIENAVKFSPSGSNVEICSREENGCYIFEVKDHGRGMSDYEIANIAPFFQYNRQLLQQDGNGLGLITIKKFLSFYNGALTILSEKEVHTTVTCRIPILKNSLTEYKIKSRG